MEAHALRGRSPLLTVWLPIVVWAALIFALSSIPSLGTGLGTWDTILRKCAHVTEYAVLAFLLRRALSTPWAFAAAVGYAVTDEFHQTFVRGRHGAPRDVLIDSIGIVIGLVAARRVLR
jgi:VanZ family protein